MNLGDGRGNRGIDVILPVVAELARALHLRLTISLLIACCASALLVACGGEDADEAAEQQTRTAVPTRPEAVAPPASDAQDGQDSVTTERSAVDPVRLQIAEADALERNGYWEQALNLRESAMLSGSSLPVDDLTELQLDHARLLLKLNRPEHAQIALMELGESLSADKQRRRLLLAAQAALMRNQVDAAVEAMRSYVNSDSPAWAIVALETGRVLQRAGRSAESIEWVGRSLGGLLSFQDRLRAIHLLATELDIGGDAESALDRYGELIDLSPWRDDQAAALSRVGRLQSELGDSKAAHEVWLTLVEGYREYPESSEALAFLLDAGVLVDELTVGLIRFEEQRWVEARAAMLNVLGGSSVVADQVAGEFYIAAIHQANGDLESAALGYVAVIGRDSSDALAAESMMRLADFAAADGDLSVAGEYWRRVWTEHPQHARAEEAARRWALRAVARGQWLEAAQRFRDIANTGADYWGERVRLEFLYWSALMYREAGDVESASDLGSQVVESDPGGYFGLRAASLLGLESPDALDISLDDWLVRLTGEADPSVIDLQTAPEWLAAQELRLGGWDDAADRMLLQWIDRLADDPWELVEASQLLAAHNETSASARAAERVLDLFGLTWTEAPVDLLRLAYPKPWPDVMALHAGSEGLDPLLLWSLIRRESLYDADAAGLAGEVGLTQVIPLTGSDIAAGLGIAYQHTDLARPELAIRFGSWYLARQMEGFSNEPLIALAAYNAGPGNAARWEDQALLPGPDAFLAAMDFRSTRSYVRYVLETWAAYQAVERATERAAQ